MEAWIAFAIFAAVPLCFVAYCVWLVFTDRTKGGPEVYPLGDATETPTTLHQTRRANHAKRG